MHAIHVHRMGARRDQVPASLEKLLDLVAIGTVADLAALRGENRYYVKEGLKLVGIGQRVGIRALATVAACTGVVDSGTVAYRLAPRLNAAGRLADPSPPLRLLLTDDEKEAASLAATLHELNGARQDVERQIFEQAIAVVEALPELPPALVLAGAEWHEGVVGIVASRLVERFHRPTILLGVRDGVAKGSGRSIGGYDLMAGLNAGAGHLTVYGGHKQAVGLTLAFDRVDELPAGHRGACGGLSRTGRPGADLRCRRGAARRGSERRHGAGPGLARSLWHGQSTPQGAAGRCGCAQRRSDEERGSPALRHRGGRRAGQGHRFRPRLGSAGDKPATEGAPGRGAVQGRRVAGQPAPGVLGGSDRCACRRGGRGIATAEQWPLRWRVVPRRSRPMPRSAAARLLLRPRLRRGPARRRSSCYPPPTI